MKYYKVLLLIGVLAGFLRFWLIGSIPPSLTWDEVAWGYNAYSLGIDGRDEFGRFLPLDYLESFGDFKPPVYAYLDVIPVKLFGLTEFAVRFPSAFFGTLTVLITYFLVLRIFPKNYMLALFSAFFLAISPWHINLSRAAFEANVASFFIICGVWAFLAAVQGRRWYLIISALAFVLSMYTFNTARIISPLLVVFLAFTFRKQLIGMKKQTIIAFATGVLLLLPTLPFLFSPQAALRYKEVNIFSDVNLVSLSNKQVENDGGAFWSGILHNRRFIYAVEYVRHYLDHFSPQFLFVKGDGNPKFSTQDVGQLYLWEIPFFTAGILFLLKKRIGYWWLVPVWLLLGILPAATARETPHALRIETTLPTFQIFTAYGTVMFFGWLKALRLGRWIKRSIILLVFLMLSFNVVYYVHGYYAHYSNEYSGEWQYGYKDAISYVQSIAGEYDQINMTNELGRPYIYFLFYIKESPQAFRETMIVEREALGFVTVHGFSKYRFAKSASDLYETGENALFIDTPTKVPYGANVKKEFFLRNGLPVLVAYTL